MAKSKLNKSKALVEMAASMRARVAQQAAQRSTKPRAKEPRDKGVLLDATPERLAKEPDAEIIEVRDDRNRAGTVIVRRFRSTHLDRLHKNGRLTLAQWTAGDWYRNKYEEGHPPLRVTAKYGEHVPGGEPDYGLARNAAQLRARDDWKKAREQWSREQQGYMDRLLIRDELPRYGGRRAMQNMTFIRHALDDLASYLRY